MLQFHQGIQHFSKALICNEYAVNVYLLLHILFIIECLRDISTMNGNTKDGKNSAIVQNEIYLQISIFRKINRLKNYLNGMIK